MFVNIGFGNFINSSQIVSICRADSAPMKRMVSEARSKGSAVDATQGRKTKSVILTGSGHLVLSALTPETLTARCNLTVGKTQLQEEEVNEVIYLLFPVSQVQEREL